MDSFKSNHPLQPHSSAFHNPLPWAHKSNFTNLISYPEFQTPANSFISSTWKLLCKQVAFPAKPNNAHSSEVQGSEVLILKLVMRDGKLECGELLWTGIEVEGSLKQASKKQFELPALITCCCIFCSSNRRNVGESVGPLWTIPQIAQKKPNKKWTRAAVTPKQLRIITAPKTCFLDFNFPNLPIKSHEDSRISFESMAHKVDMPNSVTYLYGTLTCEWYIHSKFRNINLLNVTPSLVSRNPR